MRLIILFLIVLFLNNFLSAQVKTLPYYSGWDLPSQTEGWNQFRTGFESQGAWSYSNNNFPFSPPNNIDHDYNVGGNQKDTVIDWFVSPPLAINGNANLSLKVMVTGFSPPTVDNLEIMIGTENQDPHLGSFSFVANLSYMEPKGQWLDTTITLPFISGNAWIAIKYKAIGAAWWTPRIDNFRVESTTSSIEPEISENSFIIYPNPIKDKARIYLRNVKNSGPTSVEIFDDLGRIVKQINSSVTDNIFLSREGLSKGIYFVKLTQNGNFKGVQKVVIE